LELVTIKRHHERERKALVGDYKDFSYRKAVKVRKAAQIKLGEIRLEIEEIERERSKEPEQTPEEILDSLDFSL